MRVLVSGFEPFGGSVLNPSFEVLKRLRSDPLPNLTIDTVVLPVVGGQAPKALIAAVKRTQPSALVMLGESGRAERITIERVAINLRDYRIPDNRGAIVRDRKVVRGGPDAYFATLPLRTMVHAVEAAGVPVELSLSAGSFLCNEVMYAALHHAATRAPRMVAGFVHLPRTPEQNRGTAAKGFTHSMPLEETARGVRALVAALIGALGPASRGRVSPRGSTRAVRRASTKGR